MYKSINSNEDVQYFLKRPTRCTMAILLKSTTKIMEYQQPRVDTVLVLNKQS